MTGANDQSEQRAVHAAICVDSEALDRFGSVIRHLVVGLIDEAVHVRLVSSDERIEALSLGPIKADVHPRLVWPFAKRRSDELLEALSSQTPTIVHALSQASYELAGLVSETFDADLVLQVTSQADCDKIASSPIHKTRRFLAFSDALAHELGDQLAIEPEDIRVIRPGVQAAKSVACFVHPERTPTIFCSSGFDRGSGVALLIEAIEILRSRDRELMVFLLGEGNRESQYRKMIRDAHLASWITLVNPKGELVQAMRSADIFVRPAAALAVNADVLEAMGAGMAVVSVDSSICDHLHHQQNALVCEDNAQSLAAAIEGLLDDPSHAQSLAAAAIEYIRTHHSMSTMALHTAKAYRELALAGKTLSLPE